MMVCRKSMILGQSCLALGLLLLLSVDAGQAPVVPDITGTDVTGTNGMGQSHLPGLCFLPCSVLQGPTVGK